MRIISEETAKGGKYRVKTNKKADGDTAKLAGQTLVITDCQKGETGRITSYTVQTLDGKCCTVGVLAAQLDPA